VKKEAVERQWWSVVRQQQGNRFTISTPTCRNDKMAGNQERKTSKRMERHNLQKQMIELLP